MKYFSIIIYLFSFSLHAYGESSHFFDRFSMETSLIGASPSAEGVVFSNQINIAFFKKSNHFSVGVLLSTLSLIPQVVHLAMLASLGDKYFIELGIGPSVIVDNLGIAMVTRMGVALETPFTFKIKALISWWDGLVPASLNFAGDHDRKSFFFSTVSTFMGIQYDF